MEQIVPVGAHEPNWWEFRFKHIKPIRRGYHSTFIHNDHLYVFGGKDIGGFGHLNNTWRLDISQLENFEPG